MFSIICSVLLCSNLSWGLDSADVLPRGINSPALRMGQVRGIDLEFTERGSLRSLSDGLSVEADASVIASSNSDGALLVNVLNSLGPYRYGDQLSLGVLHIDSKPSIDYTAIVHAWGITDRWTLGFGLPALRYKNQISVYETGSNVAAYQAQFSDVSPLLQSGLNQIASISLVQKFSSDLVTKGYKPLESRAESLWGDLQVVSLFQLLKEKSLGLTHKLVLILPTGKKEDPNDLSDLDLYGRPIIENHLIANQKIANDWSLNGRIGAEVLLPDQAKKRVPMNDADFLPDQDGLENVNRLFNVGTSAGGSLNWDMTSFWSTGLGYEFRQRNRQEYTGDLNRSYSSLSKDTETQAQTARLGFNFSTVNAYQKKTFALPMMAGLEINDTVAGKNIPRETRTEFSLTLFY